MPRRRPGRAAWRRLLLTPAVCALVAFGTSGCGSSAGTSSSGTSSSGTSSSGPAASSGSPSDPMSHGSMGGSSSSMPATATEIMIENFSYTVPPSVAAGATVAVMNMDSEAHTVTADSGGAFDVPAAPGTTVTFTAPTTPGSYVFHCTYHATMHGVLVVR